MKYTKDYYQILGVGPQATPAEIRRAYRRLAILYHPDRNPMPQANARMQEVNEAYSVLGDQDERRKYDAERLYSTPAAPIYVSPYNIKKETTPRSRKAVSWSRVWLVLLLTPAMLAVSVISARPRMLWRYECGDPVTAAPEIHDGIAYFASIGEDGPAALYAVDASTGEEIWMKYLSGSAFWSPVVTDELVAVGTDSGSFYGFDRSTGETRWVFQPDQSIPSCSGSCARNFGKPILLGDTIYVGALGGTVYALDSRTGQLRWFFVASGRIFDAPAISGDRLYVGSSDGIIYAISISTGLEMQRYYVSLQDAANGRTSVNGTPVVDGTTLYAVTGSSDGRDAFLLALDIQTGQAIWQIHGPSPIDQTMTSPLLYEDLIIVTSIDGLYGIDKATGEVRWDFSDPQRAVFFSPALDDGILYFGDTEGYLYSIRAGTGRLIRKYNMNLLDLSSYTNWTAEFVFEPAVEADTAYVGWFNSLYAIRIHN